MYVKLMLLLFAAHWMMSCGSERVERSMSIRLAESFQTRSQAEYNLDSPAVWAGNDGQYWIITTAKDGNCLVVHDARNGAFIQTFGEAGTDKGKFRRPNGIAITGNYAFIVERDNRRIQLLSLPEFETVSVFGNEYLKRPYGIYVHEDTTGQFQVYVSDNFENPASSEDFIRRIHHYTGTPSGEWMLIKTFGDTSGAGKLSIVESIYGDPDLGRIFIAEEDTVQSSIKLYDLEGRFTGKVFGREIFKHQVEGLTIHLCGKSDGILIATDQSDTGNRFHLFDRKSLSYIGSFHGPQTRNTDGIWLHARPVPGFTSGLFVAIHDDQAVSGFDFQSILTAFDSDISCNGPKK